MNQIVGEILSLNLKDDYTQSEINDYIFTIKDYNIRNEIDRLQIEMRGISDNIRKIEIAQRIMVLKMMEQERKYD